MADEKGGGLFGGGKPAKPADAGASTSFLAQELSGISTRLRTLEERNSNFRKKQQLIEQSMLTNRKRLGDEIAVIREEIDEMKKTINTVEERIIMLIKELRLTAKKEDVDTLSKYIEMWEPLNFVTQNQVEKIIKDLLEEERESK